MANTTEQLSQHLSANVLKLRRKLGFSQVQLAQKAQIPRSTLTYIESGQSNPSLSNLAKISEALQVSLEELLSAPQSATQLVKSRDVPVETKSKSQVRIEKLLPDPISGMEIDRMNFAPKARFKGTPHISRTKEYLYCAWGKVAVYVNRTKFELSAGDVLAFPGDEPHAYENVSSKTSASCFSVVVFAPNLA
jgi:transcriptional regulator with XRE-family HTH domain